MNIIYVDDEKIQLENFRLTASGLKGMESLQLFGSSLQAYEWAKEHRVDAAFLDIEMPHMNGMELAESLKALNPDVKIIFVTAYDQYAVKAFKIRASGYLLKPYTRTDIESELENILSGTEGLHYHHARLSGNRKREKYFQRTQQAGRTVCPPGTPWKSRHHKRRCPELPWGGKASQRQYLLELAVPFEKYSGGCRSSGPDLHQGKCKVPEHRAGRLRPVPYAGW